MSVHARGNKWIVRYRDEEGKNRSPSFDTKGEAKEFDRQVNSAKYRGEAVSLSRGTTTVGDYWRDEFFPTAAVSLNTRQGYEEKWTTKKPERERVWHLRKKWDNVALKDVTRKTVRRWHREMEDAGATSSQMRNAHKLLVRIVSVAVEDGMLSHNDILRMVPEYKPRVPETVWLPETIEAVRGHLIERAMKPPPNVGAVGKPRRVDYEWRRRRDATLVSVLGYQAPRSGEALALRWERILDGDEIARIIDIIDRIPGIEDPRERRGTTKTHEHRTLELTSWVREDLHDWWRYCGRPRRGYVFARGMDGERFTKDTFQAWREQVWQKSLARLGIAYEPPKHLRTSCVSTWIRAGWDVGSAADEAGHDIDVLIKTYRKPVREFRRGQEFDIEQAVRTARSGAGRVRRLFAVDGEAA